MTEIRRIKPLFYYGTLFVVSTLLFYFYSKDINLKIAWGGFGPHDYVNQKLYPENYANDFLGTAIADHYDKSVVMKSFYIAKKWFDIDPSAFLFPFMFIQCLLFVFGLGFLITTFFEDEKYTLVGILIVCLSGLAGLNLSRFGGYGGVVRTLQTPLYYGYSYAFTFFAISFSLREHYLFMFLFLTAAICTHVTLGIFACIFCGSYYLLRPKEILDSKFLVGLLIFLIIAGYHVLSIMQNTSISTGAMDVQDWVKSTRMFCYHWYPVTMKMFTTRAHKEFLPILFALIAFFVALKPLVISSDKVKKIILGVSSCILMTAVGIICVEIFEVVTLIKISLQRSSWLISFFAVVFYGYYLYQKINEDDVVPTIVASIALMTLVLAKPGISLLPMLILVFYDIKKGKLSLFSLSGRVSKLLLIINLIFLGALIVLSISNVIKNAVWANFWSPFMYFNPLNSYDFVIRGGENIFFDNYKTIILLFAIVSVIVCLNKFAHQKLLMSRTNVIVILLLCLLVSNLNKTHGTYKKHEIAQAYLDIQLWARDNTSNNALFMQDPTHSYAWRDFSQRSSFGTFRDWGYCGIAYDSNQRLYLDGKKRMFEFGVNLDQITLEEINNYAWFPYSTTFFKKIRELYYSMTPQQFMEFGKKYSISHIVIRKAFLDESHTQIMRSSFECSYENDHYCIFTL